MSRHLMFALNLTLAALLASACQREEPPAVVPPPATATQPLPAVADKLQQTTPLPPPVPPAPQAPPSERPTTTLPSRSLGPRLFLRETLAAQLLELPTDALSTWRTYREEKPALLLLSNHPFLAQVPEPLRVETTTLLRQGDQTTISTRSQPYRSDPLLLPAMAVDAALRQGWFGRLLWAIPLRDPAQALSLDAFRKQFLEGGLAEQGEIDTLGLTDNVLTGTLRNTPVSAATLPNLPEITGPVIVHIDLSYFNPLYKNEVSTPLLPIVGSTLKALQARNLRVLAVTISQGSLDQALALDVRFLGGIIETLARKPELLDQELPANWQRKADTLYLENFFQREIIRDTLLAMEKAAPQDAAIKFALCRSSAADKQGGKALDYLARAVALDKVYALEYLALSEMAYEKKFPGEALRMLSLATNAFPDNPHIKLKTAQLAHELGDPKTALHLAEQLRQLPWSPVYYPDMPDYLAGFVEFLKQPPQPKPVDDTTKP